MPKKGFAHVAAAASDDYGLVFVGGDRPAGLDDERLHFLGGRPAAEMPGIYRCADVMVVASVGECPLTVLEAMSSGLPVLANDDPALHSPWTSGPGVRFVDMAAGRPAGAPSRTWSPIRRRCAGMGEEAPRRSSSRRSPGRPTSTVLEEIYARDTSRPEYTCASPKRDPQFSIRTPAYPRVTKQVLAPF